MAVAVNTPTRREERKDPLDTIMRGLSIASSVYGIKDAAQKAKLFAENSKFEQAAKTADLASKGFEKQVGEDGDIAFLRAPGFQDPEAKYKEAQLAKMQAETEAIRRGRSGGGRDALADEMNMARLQKMRDEQKSADFKKTPEGRVQALNTGDKQRLDNVRMGFDTIGRMTQALQNGDNTFSVIGDNDFTLAARGFEEALGRMQSGGAIQRDEAARFRALAPKVTDSAEMQMKKLSLLENEFGARFGTLGFKPEDFGMAYQSQQAPASELQISDSIGLRPPRANAGLSAPSQKPKPQSAHPQDSAAVQWAKANPQDQRSAAILKANGF